LKITFLKVRIEGTVRQAANVKDFVYSDETFNDGQLGFRGSSTDNAAVNTNPTASARDSKKNAPEKGLFFSSAEQASRAPSSRIRLCQSELISLSAASPAERLVRSADPRTGCCRAFVSPASWRRSRQ
jgi:hypothetical protein